jgi:hypothetical protein
MRTKRPLVLQEILHSADAHRETTGRWPTRASGLVLGMRGETWAAIDRALRHGLRGLPGGSSLAQLLARQRKARPLHQLPLLTEEQVRPMPTPTTRPRGHGRPASPAASPAAAAKPGRPSTTPCTPVPGASPAAPPWPACLLPAGASATAKACFR